MTISRLFSLALFITLSLAVAGCYRHAANHQNHSPVTASPANEQPAAPEGQQETEAGAAAETPGGLAELSVEDRELATKQRVCPVSGELLGAMGKPFKTTVKGRTVFLCCEGCEKELKDNADKYLAKLKVAEEKK
jgi:YHS domain-containing protein